MGVQNEIGDRGESIFRARISENHLFRVYFLGEKTPDVDFLLEIADEHYPYYFMVQVKSTTSGYTKQGKLKATISKEKLKKLIDKQIPTYLAGVNVYDEKVFICPAFDINIQYNTIPINNILSCNDKENSKKTLELLKKDVIQYYESFGMNSYKPSYKSLL